MFFSKNGINELYEDFLLTAVSAGLVIFFITMSVIAFINGSLLGTIGIALAIYEGLVCFKVMSSYKNMRAQKIPKKDIEAFNRMNPTA